MDLNLKDKRVVVTGGSAGIGAAIVETFADEGCEVHFCARNPSRIRDLEATIRAKASNGRGAVSGSAIDMTDRPAVSAWFDAIGKVDIVVANVSALSGDWSAALTTDLHATLNTFADAASRIQADGAITYIGSKASGIGTPGFEAYGAVKAALTHYTKSQAMYLGAAGIRVNVVSPGDTFVEGGFWDGIRKSAPDAYDAAVKGNPMGRLARPEEIARVVAFVSSPVVSFVNGANWHVDGGGTSHVQL